MIRGPGAPYRCSVRVPLVWRKPEPDKANCRDSLSGSPPAPWTANCLRKCANYHYQSWILSKRSELRSRAGGTNCVGIQLQLRSALLIDIVLSRHQIMMYKRTLEIQVPNLRTCWPPRLFVSHFLGFYNEVCMSHGPNISEKQGFYIRKISTCNCDGIGSTP
jgi:hypothetical protein